MEGKFNYRNAQHSKVRKLNAIRKLANVTFPTLKRRSRKRDFRLNRGKKQPLSTPAKTSHTQTEGSTLKFGAFNINGLDVEAGYVVDELLENRDFDVHGSPINALVLMKQYCRFLLLVRRLAGKTSLQFIHPQEGICHGILKGQVPRKVGEDLH